MRFYGFSADELTTGTDRNLPLDKDPKLAWALRHREFFPVDVNKAGKTALLRVPGFGVRNVERILNVRRYRTLTLADLAKLKISVKKSQYFIVTADSSPAHGQIDSPKLPQRFAPPQQQLALFEAAETARSGEL
jgi:predicted DNA-binding helix-hairpin-helix protein